MVLSLDAFFWGGPAPKTTIAVDFPVGLGRPHYTPGSTNIAVAEKNGPGLRIDVFPINKWGDIPASVMLVFLHLP